MATNMIKPEEKNSDKGERRYNIPSLVMLVAIIVTAGLTYWITNTFLIVDAESQRKNVQSHIQSEIDSAYKSRKVPDESISGEITIDYLNALAAANRFLEAWTKRDGDRGYQMLSTSLKSTGSEEDLKMTITGTSNPHHYAYEICGGKMNGGNVAIFNVHYYDIFTGTDVLFPRGSPDAIQMVKESSSDIWYVDAFRDIGNVSDDLVGILVNGSRIRWINLSDADTIVSIVLNRNTTQHDVCRGPSSIPVFCPDGKRFAFIMPNAWETIGEVLIYDSGNEASEVVLKSNILPPQASPKLLCWYDQRWLLVIIGFAYGTVSVGGDVYWLDTKKRTLHLYLRHTDSDKEEFRDIAILETGLRFGIAKHNDDFNGYTMRDTIILHEDIKSFIQTIEKN